MVRLLAYEKPAMNLNQIVLISVFLPLFLIATYVLLSTALLHG